MPHSRDFEQQLQDRLVEIEARIEGHSADLDPVQPHVEWAADPESVPGILGEFARDRVVYLTQADFAHGTLRVLVPCKLVLCESVEFDPNSGVNEGESKIDPDRDDAHDWLPHEGQAAYLIDATAGDVHGTAPSKAFRLGFFAAMTIEHTKGTIVELNGFQLSSSLDFAMQQRFHATIELANQPFIPNQGPADFGSHLRPARQVWIRNGELGRTSHHGIHGNGMQDLLISDVTFRDYEVAGISLNGGKRIIIRDCQLDGTFTQVPISGTYSAGRFAKLVGTGRIKLANQITQAKNTKSNKKNSVPGHDTIKQCAGELSALIGHLNAELDVAFDLAKEGKLAEIDPLFRNPISIDGDSNSRLHLADANPYGIAIHSRGVLVNAFLCHGTKLGSNADYDRIYECTDITIERVNIARTRGKVREVLALAAQETEGEKFNVVSDAAGAVFRFFPQLTTIKVAPDVQPPEMNRKTGLPDLTILGKVQIGIANLELAMVEAGLLTREQMVTRNLEPIVDWANGDGSKIKPTTEPHKWKLRARQQGGRNVSFELRSNGDLMHHVNKGALGLFVQGVHGLRLSDIVVAVVENAGIPGSNLAGAYRDATDGGHGQQEQQIGYSGADARGIYIGACGDITTDSIQAHGIKSQFGHAYGFELAGGSSNASIHRTTVGNVIAGAGYESSGPIDQPGDRLPNPEPQAIGFYIDSKARDVGLKGLDFTGKIQQPGPHRSVNFRAESLFDSTIEGS